MIYLVVLLGVLFAVAILAWAIGDSKIPVDSTQHNINITIDLDQKG